MRTLPFFFAFAFAFVMLSTGVVAQIILIADQEQAIYSVGESMSFLVTSPESGLLTYSIRHDRYSPALASGTLNVIANQTATIPFTLDYPGMVLCWVHQGGMKATAGAAFSPFDIPPFEQAPDDLLNFWDNLKEQLAQIPIEPIITFEADGDYSTSYRINLPIIDDRRVYGYISVPDGEGPFPAVLQLPPFGSSPNIVNPDFHTAERTGCLAMSISIHNAEPDEEDPQAYQPDIINDENMNYYRYAILGAIRALDYLVSRDDYDGEHLAVMGVSQGGGLSLLLAGLDDRVKALAYSNPALCQHTGLKYDRASGFPYYLRKSEVEYGTQEHFDQTVAATKYYDAACIAKFYKGPSFGFIGYRDTICPPATSYAAFNQLPGPKILVQAREVGHHHPAEYQVGRYDLFRRYFPSTLTPPWPWPDTTTGYFIEAVASQNEVATGEMLSLIGMADLNGETSGDWTVQWRQVSGSGTASFSDAEAWTTEVSFDQAGHYRLAFRVVDEAADVPDKYYTLIDYVEVEVCEHIVEQLSVSICEGESIQIGSETYETEGTYQQVFPISDVCDSVLLINLTVNALPGVDLGADALISTDSILALDLSSNNYTSLLWNDGSTGEVFLFDGGQSGPGVYEVSVLVENEFHCFAMDTILIEVTQSVYTEEKSTSTFEVILFPNPVEDVLYILVEKGVEGAHELKLINAFGEVIYTKISKSEQMVIRADDFPQGLYFVNVSMVEGEGVVVKKLFLSGSE